MATLSFITYFDTSQLKFRIQDTTNYSGQGLIPANIKGVLKIVTPRGITYDNTSYSSPDVNPSVSLYSGYIALPVNAQGYIMAGTYTVTYSIQDSGNGNAISNQSNTYSYSFIIPEITITQTVDGYNSTFTSIDSTTYGTPVSHTRTHSVTPPSGSPLSPTSNSNSTISYPANIWSGIWTSVITSVLTYTQGDLVIDVAITGTETVKAYLNDMSVIRTYIEDLNDLYDTARKANRDMSYHIQGALLKIATAYEGYDLALYYNDLTTAYLRTVDIIEELNDYITITFPEEIIPFVNHQGGSSHQPVSVSNAATFGINLSAAQVMTFSLATTGHGGFLPTLSGNATDYFGGDGSFHALTGGGDVFKTDFAAFDSTRAITAINITNWNTAYSNTHTHANKSLLDTYTQTDVNLASAVSLKHTHANKTLLDTYDQTNANITSAISLKHTHANKALLDTYTQTEANLASAVSLKHSHANKALLDTYTQTNVNITTAISQSHTHANKTLLDTYTQTDIGLADAVSKKHAHSNLTLLETYTQTDTDITTAITQSHTHSNKTLLDTLTSGGTGDQFLSDVGDYRAITISGVTDTQVVYIDGTATAGNANLTFDKTTNTLTSLISSIGTAVITTELDFTDNTVSIYNSAGNMTFKDTSYTKTLTELVSGATNYWTASGSNIYFGTGTDRVGINQSVPSAELDVIGHIVANNFDSDLFRYKNSNVLIGPNAGDQETGSGFFYLDVTNRTDPLIYADFTSRKLEFNGDMYVLGSKILNFGTAITRIYRSTGDNLTFNDAVANSGNPINLVQLIDETYNVLKAGFNDLAAVKLITTANKSDWNKAAILVTSGGGTLYLDNSGKYTSPAGGGVTPTDYTWKWDASLYYRPYSSKTEAGGVASSGKFWTGTDNPTATNRINYDGNLHVTNLFAHSTIEATSSSGGLVLQATDTTRYLVQVMNDGGSAYLNLTAL